MAKRRFGIADKLAILVSIACFAAPLTLVAQSRSFDDASPQYGEQEDVERLTMIASTSRVLTMEYDIPFVVVGNQKIIKANPVSPNQILITALTPGVTALSLTDPDNQTHTIEIQVVGDTRELQATLDARFPEAQIQTLAIRDLVLVSGHVNRADDVPRIMQISRAFFPDAVDDLTVGGSQKVMLKVKVVEVSRTKLRKMGIDWSVITSDFNFVNGISGLINTDGTSGLGTIRSAVTNGSSEFNLLIDTLEQNNLAKILAEPTLTTMSGRPAGFLSGGEVPVPISTGLGTQSVQFQPFGTKLDFVPIVLGGGRIRLEVRPEVRELAGDLRDPVSGAPGFRTRRVDTGVEMQVGQTLALAGLIQNRIDSQERGLPVLKDMPWVGALFRRVEETFNEVELVILVTPYFINEVDGSVLPIGPGRNTVVPNDNEFYNKGYREVPSCGNPYELGPIQGDLSSQSGLYQQQTQVQNLPAAGAETGYVRNNAPQSSLDAQQNVAPQHSDTSPQQKYIDQSQQMAPQQGYSQRPVQTLPETPEYDPTFSRRPYSTRRQDESGSMMQNTGFQRSAPYPAENGSAAGTTIAPTTEGAKDRYFPRPSLFGIGE